MAEDRFAHHHSAAQARRMLEHRATAERAIDGIDPRPYGRTQVIGGVLQAVFFVLLALALWFLWNWVSVLVLSVIAIGAGLWMQRASARRRVVIPRGMGSELRRIERWSRIGLIAIPVAAALVAPRLLQGAEGTGPAGLVVGVLGLALALPRIVLGVRMWRR